MSKLATGGGQKKTEIYSVIYLPYSIIDSILRNTDD
jgi:hypothetical protein